MANEAAKKAATDAYFESARNDNQRDLQTQIDRKEEPPARNEERAANNKSTTTGTPS